MQIHFATNTFQSTKVIEREKRGLISYLSFLLKNTAQPEKRDIFRKNGNEGWDELGDSQKRFPWAERGKYGPRKEPIRW